VNRLFQEVHQMKSGLEEMVRQEAKVIYSLGVASYGGGSVNPNSLMKQTDKSLSNAKRNGRKRCGPLLSYPGRK
jgi:PleD family two-component response regulator